MLILLTAVGERIGAGLVFLEKTMCKKYSTTVRPIRIVTLGYPKETIPAKRYGLFPLEDLIRYRRWQAFLIS